MNVSQRLIRAYLRRPDKKRVLNFVHAVIDLMPYKKDGATLISAAALPRELRPLVPLISKWALSDDVERAQKLKRCAESTRQKLTDTVIPLLPVIDKFLDSFGINPPEEVCVLGDLAQTALEAKSLLPIKN